jgi:polyisoprenyl-phosphate glycosyltransferase
MMSAMDRGADVVYGQRVQREGEGRFKRLTAFVFYRLLGMFAEVEIPRDTGDFRLMKRRVVDALNAMPEQHRFIRGMVAWLGFTQTPLPYVRDRRFAGATKYSLFKMTRFAADAVTGFSISPLRLGSILAGLCFLLTGVLGVSVVYAWFALNVVRGWSSILAVFLLFTGVQLLVLGVIGEYVGRTYVEVKRRPLFIISDIVTQASSHDAHDRGI